MTNAIRRIVLWLVFSGLVLLSVWGFHSGQLFKQYIWEPVGMQRLMIFAAIYLVWSLVLNWWRPAWFLPLSLLIALVYTSVAAGPVAVAAVLYFLCSALVLGTLLLRRNGDYLLALLVGISLYVLLIGALVHFPVNYPLVYAGLFAVPLLVAMRKRLRLPRPAVAPVSSVWERITRSVTVFILLVQWVITLKPEIGTDALAMHLTIPVWVAQRQIWPFDFRHLTWSVMPMNADWGFTAVYLLGGEYAARLLNFCLLAIVAALLGSAVRRWLSAGTAWLLVALFLSTPVAWLVTGSLFAENFWAATLFGAAVAVWTYRDTGTRSYLFAAAILGGTAVASKYGALVYAVVLVCFAAVEAWRRRHFRVAWLSLACFCIFAAPPYVNALVKTGNPVYPFFNTVFRSPYFDQQVSFSDGRFETPTGWATLYDVTFHTKRYMECHNGAAGFHYLLLIPLSLLLVGRRWPYAGWVAAVTSLAGMAVTFNIQANLRYVYPALPLVMVFVAVALGRLQVVDKFLYRAVVCAMLASFGLNIYFLPSSGFWHADFAWFAIGGHAQAERYVIKGAPVRPIIEYLNQEHPDLPVAFFHATPTAGFRGRAYIADSWHTDAFARRLRKVESVEECRHLLEELGVRYVVAPSSDSGLWATQVPVESYLAGYTESEFQSGPYVVARIRDGEIPEPPHALPDRYDDLDREVFFQGPWIRGRDFPEAAAGGVTYCDSIGATFTFRFTGSEVTWVYTAAHNRGTAEVILDGEPRGRVDLYSPTIIWEASFSVTGLAAGSHTLEVRILPEKNPASTGNYVDVDSFVVR